MNTKDLYRTMVGSTDRIVKMYLADFSDADLLVRPVPEANHTAWQIGHLISAERSMIEALKAGSAPELPAGFAERHAKSNARSDDPSNFQPLAVYMDLYEKQRAATVRLIETIGDSELDEPGPEPMRAMAPTKGVLLSIVATHPMLHCGQFVVVRRKLGKPVLM